MKYSSVLANKGIPRELVKGYSLNEGMSPTAAGRRVFAEQPLMSRLHGSWCRLQPGCLELHCQLAPPNVGIHPHVRRCVLFNGESIHAAYLVLPSLTFP